MRTPLNWVACGLLLMIMTSMAGGYMDVWWHVMDKVETFYTVPHMILYAGVLFGGLFVLFYVIAQMVRLRTAAPADVPHAGALALAGTGSLLQLLAGVTDNIYHSIMGFDVTIWSPPHLLVIFGGVVCSLGAAELFLSSPHKLFGKVGAIMSYGMAITVFHFALAEFDVNTNWSLGIRWIPYTPYYPLLIMPIMIYATVRGTARIGWPLGTAVTSFAFLYKLGVYLGWSSTSLPTHFPLLLFCAGIAFDAAYLLLRRRTPLAALIAAIAMAAVLVAVVALQAPVAMGAAKLLASLAATAAAGAAFAAAGGAGTASWRRPREEGRRHA